MDKTRRNTLYKFLPPEKKRPVLILTGDSISFQEKKGEESRRQGPAACPGPLATAH